MLEPQSDPTVFLTLAPELIHAICERLEHGDIKQLRLTSKKLADLLFNHVLRTATIDIYTGYCEHGLSKLVELATSKHAACDAARELKIVSLAPGYNPTFRLPGMELRTEDPVDISFAKETMDVHLFNAIRSMKGLRSVIWMPRVGDEQHTQRTVMNALKTLTNLCRFEIHLYNCKIPLELDALTNLQEITLKDVSQLYQEELLEAIARLVARTPNLTSIDVSTDVLYKGHITKLQSLHQFFKYYPPDSPPLRLSHLTLDKWMIRLDSLTIPHLIHLTSLELIEIRDPLKPPSSLDVAAGRGDAVMTLEEKRQFSSTLDEVWKTLQNLGVRLQTITLIPVTTAFLDYLSSYSGLKKLVVVPGSFHNPAGPLESLAERLFAESLLSHASLLEDLDIPSPLKGLWCFRTPNSNAISKLTNIKNLRMSISASVISSRGPARKEQQPVVELFVRTAVESMPRIECIRILLATNPETRRCWGTSGQQEVLTDSIATSLRNYVPPPGCRRLPAMMVGQHVIREKMIIPE